MQRTLPVRYKVVKVIRCRKFKCTGNSLGKCGPEVYVYALNGTGGPLSAAERGRPAGRERGVIFSLISRASLFVAGAEASGVSWRCEQIIGKLIDARWRL